MTDTAPLEHFPRPTVAVDLVLMTVRGGVLEALVVQRGDTSGWALPGGIVRIDESLEATVSRVLDEKVGLGGAFVEQLYTFGRPDRDPRGRVISVAHYALVPAQALEAAVGARDQVALGRTVFQANGEAGVLLAAGQPTRLAFDHSEILAVAVQRLRGKLDYTAVGLELLPEKFPLRDLQAVHEAILGHALTKPAFRRKMLDRGIVKPTGELESGGAFRPAELYRRA
jgi:8-oxo-dGTP diphosphatase